MSFLARLRFGLLSCLLFACALPLSGCERIINAIPINIPINEKGAVEAPVVDRTSQASDEESVD